MGGMGGMRGMGWGRREGGREGGKRESEGILGGSRERRGDEWNLTKGIEAVVEGSCEDDQQVAT